MDDTVDGVGKGSARSISSFNIYQAIKECSQHLSGFGGHKYAAGLTIDEDKIPEFVECFKKAAEKQRLRKERAERRAAARARRRARSERANQAARDGSQSRSQPSYRDGRERSRRRRSRGSQPGLRRFWERLLR